MRATCAICVLLGITIGSVVLADGGAIKPVTNETEASAPAVLSNPAIPSKNDVNKTNNDIAVGKPNDDITVNTTTATPNTTLPNATISAATTTSASTTPITPTTAIPTNPTTTKTTTTTTTTIPTTTANSPANSKTTAFSEDPLKTTAVPSAPTSTSTNRHFDGLSFFGGIILATCLMAIAVFSWKFYRTCNEGNYRTL